MLSKHRSWNFRLYSSELHLGQSSAPKNKIGRYLMTSNFQMLALLLRCAVAFWEGFSFITEFCMKLSKKKHLYFPLSALTRDDMGLMENDLRLRFCILLKYGLVRVMPKNVFPQHRFCVLSLEQ